MTIHFRDFFGKPALEVPPVRHIERVVTAPAKDLASEKIITLLLVRQLEFVYLAFGKFKQFPTYNRLVVVGNFYPLALIVQAKMCTADFNRVSFVYDIHSRVSFVL